MLAAGTIHIAQPSRSSEFKLWNLSDIHMASAACDEKHIRADIEEIKNDPYSFWIGTGDFAEFITTSDPRFDPNAIADWVQVGDLGNIGERTYDRLLDLFLPIAGKCLGLGLGNHERSYSLNNDAVDRHGWLCTELGRATKFGVRNLTYSSIMHICFCRRAWKVPEIIEKPDGCSKNMFRLFCHHGAGGAQTKGGKLNRLVKFMDDFDADIYMMGHVHDQTGTKETTITTNPTGKMLVATERIGVISGGYLKTYTQDRTTYGEVRGYSPTTMGAAWVTIKPETRELNGRI